MNENIEYGGNINISDEVVSIIASKAASSVSGVAGMVNTISSGFAEFLGKKNLSKGVKINMSEDNVSVDLFIIVEYGAKIPDVAWEIQEKTKSEIESMTGLNVISVNVNVEGVSVPKETDTEIPKPDADDIIENVNDESDAIVEEELSDTDDAVETVEAEVVADEIDYSANWYRKNWNLSGCGNSLFRLIVCLYENFT